MSDGIYSALSGAIARERNLSVVANNVANATTTGFQGDRAVFSEIVAQARGANRPAAQPGAPLAKGDALRFTAVTEVARDDSDGALIRTGNPLDVGLSGDGYFAISTPEGERYTRAGAFVLDGDGVLRTLSGHGVLGEGGPLSIPQDARHVLVGTDGTVRADGAEIGKLKLMRAVDPTSFVKDGLTMLRADGAVVPAADVRVTQGFLEGSNVNAVAGMNELIVTTRSFDALQKVIETFRQMDDRTARAISGG